jgi:multiple sugar transport system substrate-binding protein
MAMTRAVVRLSVVICLLALAASGFAMRGSASAAQNTDLSGELTVWAMGAEGEKLPTLAQDFMTQYPNVTVNVEPVPWDQAHQKLLTAIAGGETPDVSQIGTTWMAELAETGALAEAPEGLTGRSAEFWEAAWSTVTVDETVYGAPWYVDTRVLYYRTDLLQEAGFEQPPATWDEVKQAAVALKEAGHRYGIQLHPRADFLPFIWQAGGTVYEDGEFKLNSPEVVEALTWYQSFFTEQLTPTDPEAMDVHQAFIQGDVPMFFSGPWSIGLINDQGGAEMEGKWAVTQMPQNKTRTSFVGGSTLAVFEDSDNKEAAWAFVEFLTHPEVQATWYEQTGDLPSVKAAWESGDLATDEKLVVYGEQLADAKAPPAIPEWAEVETTAINDYLEQVTLGGMAPAEAAEAMQQTAESIV